jgi:hypothetical protein
MEQFHSPNLSVPKSSVKMTRIQFTLLLWSIASDLWNNAAELNFSQNQENKPLPFLQLVSRYHQTHQPILQDARPMKCLPLQDAGTHALIQNSNNAQMSSQPFSILNSAPTPKKVNT